MKEKGIKRDEVVLTARIDAELHAQAKTKMAGRRGESFQDIITQAIEEYVRGPGEAESASPRKNSDAIEMIAAIHEELLKQKSNDISASYGAIEVSALRIYVREIREILDNIDRTFEKSAHGRTSGTIGSGTEGSVERHDIGRSGYEPDARAAVDTERAREAIEHAGRVNNTARERLEGARGFTDDSPRTSLDAGRSSEIRPRTPPQKKYPRKKAG